MPINITNGCLRVAKEIERQIALKRAGRFAHTPGDPIPNAAKLPMLIEEVGEVAKAMMEIDGGVTDAIDIDDGGEIVAGKGQKWKDLAKELIQVAAIAVAWADSLGEVPIVMSSREARVGRVYDIQSAYPSDQFGDGREYKVIKGVGKGEITDVTEPERDHESAIAAARECYLDAGGTEEVIVGQCGPGANGEDLERWLWRSAARLWENKAKEAIASLSRVL